MATDQQGPPSGAATALPRLSLRPLTAPWLGTGPCTLYSWTCAHQDGSTGEGISNSVHDAMCAATDALAERGGKGLEQKCRLGFYQGANARDQYAYGALVGRARVANDTVVWEAP